MYLIRAEQAPRLYLIAQPINSSLLQAVQVSTQLSDTVRSPAPLLRVPECILMLQPALLWTAQYRPLKIIQVAQALPPTCLLFCHHVRKSDANC